MAKKGRQKNLEDRLEIASKTLKKLILGKKYVAIFCPVVWADLQSRNSGKIAGACSCCPNKDCGVERPYLAQCHHTKLRCFGSLSKPKVGCTLEIDFLQKLTTETLWKSRLSQKNPSKIQPYFFFKIDYFDCFCNKIDYCEMTLHIYEKFYVKCLSPDFRILVNFCKSIFKVHPIKRSFTHFVDRPPTGSN